MDLTKKRKIDDNGVPLPGSEAGLSQLTPEDARKIVEPLTQEQLLEIVQTAAIRHLDVLDAVRSIADRDVSQRKLFIRGLGWETTTEKLRGVFSVFGELEEAVVILDKTTGKSKGYGFVTFKHIDGALLSLKEPSKNIDGRMTVTQLASAGIQGTPAGLPVGAVDVSARKIYVANVPYDMPGNRLLNHFLAYGEIEEGPLGFDKTTGKSKGYALFVYKNAEGAKASLVDPVKTLDGHQLTCKLASEGKKGKPGMPGGGAPGEMPGSVQSQYGNPAGSYGGFSGGLQGPPLGHNPNSSVVGGPGLSNVTSQAPPIAGTAGIGSGYGAGIGGPYGGSLYGGPGSTGYGGYGASGGSLGGSIGYGGGLGGTGGYGGGLGTGGVGGFGGGFGGSGVESGGANAGRASGMYGMPPNSAGIPSGGYPDSVHYSLSSAFPNPHQQPAGKSPAPRAPGGVLPSGRQYY